MYKLTFIANCIYKLETENLCVSFQSSIVFLCKNSLCKYLTKLNTFLVKAVDIPQESLEHHFIFEVCQEGTDCFWFYLVCVDEA